ncbi:MAG: hypothetical protein WCK63_04705 [Betaproteobacteria bacterium]
MVFAPNEFLQPNLPANAHSLMQKMSHQTRGEITQQTLWILSEPEIFHPALLCIAPLTRLSALQNSDLTAFFPTKKNVAKTAYSIYFKFDHYI